MMPFRKKDVLPTRNMNVNFNKRRGAKDHHSNSSSISCLSSISNSNTNTASSSSSHRKLVKGWMILIPFIIFVSGLFMYTVLNAHSSIVESNLEAKIASKNKTIHYDKLQQQKPVLVHTIKNKNNSIDNSNSSNNSNNKPIFPTEYFTSSSLDNISTYTPKGAFRFIEYIDGSSPYNYQTPEIQSQTSTLASQRKIHIKNAMKHAWKGYVNLAFGYDEIKPISGGGVNKWGGLATTMTDSLDTLWIMNMKEEFQKARDWMDEHLTFDKGTTVSVFETTIRSLGGLLSAYDWSGDVMFLNKAEDLGKRLLRAFDQSSMKMPFARVNLSSGTASNNNWVHCGFKHGDFGHDVCTYIAEAGTLQVEFRYLARATNKPEYKELVENVFDILKEQSETKNGLYPSIVGVTGNGLQAGSTSSLTFGGTADSFYEYMLKLWLQGNKKEDKYRDMYDRAIDALHTWLLKETKQKLWIIGELKGNHFRHHMEHLTCFMGGLLALGAYTDPNGIESARAQRDLKTARAVTYTCYQMYAHTQTGLSPEAVDTNNDIIASPNGKYYLMRPETVESFYILNKLTGDPIYREWGWEIFQSIEKYCKTKIAYGEYADVNVPNTQPKNSMESFFLAETLKYLYLLYDDDSEIDILNKHVFNTEAHPMRIFDDI